MKKDNSFIESLELRERLRDAYLRDRDPIGKDRMLWRAQTFRHMVHLLPGQTILELGCGDGHFTRALHRVSNGENPITTVSFVANISRPEKISDSIEYVSGDSFPESL